MPRLVTGCLPCRKLGLILNPGRALLLQTSKEFAMTILDPKTGQIVTINLSSKPGRRDVQGF